MSKALFVVPPYTCWGVQVIGKWPPLQLAYVAASAEKAGYEARIFDAMNIDRSFEDIRAEIERFRPDAVMAFDYLPVTGAISTATVPAALKALSIAKEVDPAIRTMIGGPLPTFLYADILTDPENHVDFVLRGELEETAEELFRVLDEGGQVDNVRGIAFLRDGEVAATPLRPHIQDLDPVKPAWHLLEWDAYHYKIEPFGRLASILTSRGCMMGCSFCSHRQFWRGDWRARSPEATIEEIRELVYEYGVEFVTIIDPYPTCDRERWERILDMLIAEAMPVKFLMETRVEDIIRDADILHKYRDAGMVHLYLGLEASTDDMLASFNKGTTIDMNKRALDLARENDLITEASFMIGAPTETWESIEKTIRMAIELNPDIAVFPLITPMPFTPIHEEYKDRIRVTDWSQYNLATPIVEPYAMTMEEMNEAHARCYMEFYRHKAKEVLALPDCFKRRYMLSAFKVMMEGFREQFEALGISTPMLPEGMIDAHKA
ncbi:magnesium-protoporphyrin IX monomethyl ester [oxidative] cyclase [Coriobacteriaceae bacterium EMTCatB1]|nr:magnesium-protoporphyrin IX monomethyl ester [oxidative] cyclase [Coriobacteriaceae bacterium EMTCatB1]